MKRTNIFSYPRWNDLLINKFPVVPRGIGTTEVLHSLIENGTVIKIFLNQRPIIGYPRFKDEFACQYLQ